MYPNQMYPKLVEKWLKKWLKIGWRWATPPKVRRNKEFLVFLILFLLNMVVIIPNMGICYYKIGYLSSYKTKNQWLGYIWGTKRGTKGVHRSQKWLWLYDYDYDPRLWSYDYDHNHNHNHMIIIYDHNHNHITRKYANDQ